LIAGADLDVVTGGFAKGWYAQTRFGTFVQNPTASDYRFYGHRLSPQLDMFGPHLKGWHGR
jgi:hypothetical protein